MKRAQLRRVFHVVNGGTPTSEPRNWGGEVAWATPVDLAQVNGGRLHETERNLTAEGLANGSRLVPAASLIVSTRAPIGYVAECSIPMSFNQGCRGLVARGEVDIRYYRYQMLSLAERLRALGQGSTFVELSGDALSAVELATPSFEVQRAIADYIDTETARIDALIEKKQRMIELLDQLPWSTFVQAVSDVFVAEVPLRRVILRITDGPFGSSLTSAHYVSKGARVVRLGNIRTGWFDQSDSSYIESGHFNTLLRHRVLPGDLLIAGLGDSTNHVGRACIAPDLGPAIVKADCYCAKVDERLALPEFIALYLSSALGRDRVEIAARGTTRARINIEIAKEITLSLPSLTDQALVVSTFLGVKARSSAASAKIHSQLALLRERRQALITSVVTGELEVPGVAA